MLVDNPLVAVDADETVPFIVSFSLLIYSFFFDVIPIFLAVTFTTVFDWLAVSPVKSTVAPPDPRVTWSDVRSSTDPSLYAT